MIDLILAYYAYWCIIALSMIGLYAMLTKKNLAKKLIGLTILQTSVIMFFIASANKSGATIPIVDERLGTENVSLYINPLPHTLMLTAIVVGVATLGLAFALLIAIHSRYRTLSEPELLERMR